MIQLYFMTGDITKITGYDAIVNAANETLLGGGGVDGAIHKAAGPELLEECKTLGGCRTGEAKITKAYNLDCKNVIHTVGPKYLENPEVAPVMLYAAYTNSLELARRNGLTKIAFPSISTGIYKFPVKEAAKIAISAIKDFEKRYPDESYEITFVLFTEDDFTDYIQAYADTKI